MNIRLATEWAVTTSIVVTYFPWKKLPYTNSWPLNNSHGCPLSIHKEFGIEGAFDDFIDVGILVHLVGIEAPGKAAALLAWDRVQEV